MMEDFNPMKRILLIAAAWLAATAAGGEYPTVAKTGFRNAALIYELRERSKEDFKPMLAYHTGPGGKYADRRLFDAFLFLTQNVDGVRTEYGETRKAHWEKLLDTYFAPGRDVPALAAALDELNRELGSKTAAPVKVLFCVPYMSPQVTDFGDVDGDGVSENLAQKDGAAKVARWYLDEIRRRLQPYPDLQLWGLYWMREDAAHDAETIRQVADILHRENLKFLWIPYFRAANFERWREFGFDLAIMQSNYAFTAKFAGGNSRRDRLDLAAQICREHGMGFEIEFPYGKTAPERELIRQTFQAGTKYGFQQAPSAWFFSYRFDEYRSPDPAVRQVYDEAADYLSGKPFAPEKPADWMFQQESGKTVATLKLAAPARVDYLDITFDEDPANPWRGVIALEGRNRPDEAYRPLGWTIRSGGTDPLAGSRLFTFDVFADAGELKLTFSPAADSPPFQPAAIYLDGNGPRTEVAKSFGKPYRTSLAANPATYPDNAAGNKLVDGVTAGPWGNYVGWSNCPINLGLDLGPAPQPYDEIRLYTRSEAKAAIHWPSNLQAFANNRQLIAALPVMRAPAPDGLVIFQSAKRVTESNRDGVKTGYFPLRLDKSIKDRYITISGNASSWGFLAEIALYCDGKPLAMDGVRYVIGTARGKTPKLEDDGVKLTDGGFAEAVRFPAGRTSTVEIDLGEPVRIANVEVVAAGTDGATVAIEAGNKTATGFSVPLDVTAGKVKVTITPGPQGLDVSEILVR